MRVSIFLFSLLKNKNAAPDRERHGTKHGQSRQMAAFLIFMYCPFRQEIFIINSLLVRFVNILA